MKRSLFRLLASCLTIFAMAVHCGSAFGQGPSALPFNYRVEYSEIENDLWVHDVVRIKDGINAGLYVLGYYTYAGGNKRGFIYHYHYDNPVNSHLIDMPTLVGLADSEFISCTCRSMNESGIVVGFYRDSDNLIHGVYFDLFEPAPVLHRLNGENGEFEGILPLNDFGSFPNRINSVGDMLMFQGGIVVNPFIIDPDTGLKVHYPIPGAGEFTTGLDINDSGTVLMGPTDFGPLTSNIHMPNSERYFPAFKMSGEPAINNFDEFCANQEFPARGNRVNVYALRCRAQAEQADWYSDPFEVLSTDSINDSGDICGEVAGFGNPDGYLHYSSGTVIENGPTVGLQSLITDEYFASGVLFRLRLTNRIELSPTLSAPIVCGVISHDTERRLFFLIPEELPPPPNPLIFASADTPKSIPDNNTTGVTSTIGVTHDVTITNLTVTLNISHPRLSDLRATLIGPNNVSVLLPNLTGLNDVGNFDGGSSQGNWRVKVVDSVRKQTGTLNGWTLLIEH